jgi:hypothetical protein
MCGVLERDDIEARAVPPTNVNAIARRMTLMRHCNSPRSFLFVQSLSGASSGSNPADAPLV